MCMSVPELLTVQYIFTVPPLSILKEAYSLKKAYLYSAYYELLISRRSGMARVNERSQFYLLATHLSTSGMNHTCLYSPAAEHHRNLAGTHFPYC